MATVVGKNICRAGLVLSQAGQPAGNFLSWIFSLQVRDLAFDAKHLMDVGEIQVIIEQSGYLNDAGFNSPMTFCGLDMG